MALRMLWRSAAALLSEHLGPDALTALPADWTPFAHLACAHHPSHSPLRPPLPPA